MASWHGLLLAEIERFWKNIRFFSYHNRTILEIIFILLYTAEQAALLWFTFHVHDARLLSFIVSIFALAVLATFAFHKLLMESRIRILEEDMHSLWSYKAALERHNRMMTKKYHEMITSTPKPQNLYNQERGFQQL